MAEYIPDSLDFLTPLPTNSAFLEEIEEVILPSQADENAGQIDFHIPPKNLFTANKFLLSSICGVRVVGGAMDETLPTPTDEVAMVPIINLLAYKAMTMSVDGETVERYNGNTMYKSYFKFIAGHTKGWLEGNKNNTFFYCATPDDMLASDLTVTAAWKQRKALVVMKKGKALENYLPFDVCASPKMYPPGTSIRITLHHQSDGARLQTKLLNAPFLMRVQNPTLTIRRYILNKDKIEAFRKGFSIERPIVFDFPAMEIYGPYPIPKTAHNFTQRIRYGKRPNTIYLFFVDSEAEAGTFNRNALYLRNISLKEVKASYGSRSLTLKTEFDGLVSPVDAIHAYRVFIRSLGLEGTGHSSFIEYDHFVNGYTFITLTLGPQIYSTKYYLPEVDSFGDLTVSLKCETGDSIIHMFCMVVEGRSLYIRPNNIAELKL